MPGGQCGGGGGDSLLGQSHVLSGLGLQGVGRSFSEGAATGISAEGAATGISAEGAATGFSGITKAESSATPISIA